MFYSPGEIIALAIDTQLDSLEITALLGTGGMSEVYPARLKREVAIRILPDEFLEMQIGSVRFVRMLRKAIDPGLRSY